MSDNELLDLLRRSPAEGLACAVELYSAYVLKIAYTKLNGVAAREDIEEAVSDIFMSFYQSGMKNGFKIRSVRAFISVIAERHCLNLFKRLTRHEPPLPLDELEELASSDEPSEDHSSAMLAKAMTDLGEPDTTIFVRKYFFGQKSEDIARDLGMKTNTVNKRISRGLKKLRKILEEEA